MGQNTSQQKFRALKEFNVAREQFKASSQSIVSTALRPNGLFPPEIIEMILLNIEDLQSQFQLASCCKLWLSVKLSFGLRLQRRLARSNIVNGLFWTNVLMTQSFNLPNELLGCDSWTMHNTSVVFNLVYQRTKGVAVPHLKGQAHVLDVVTNKRSAERFTTHLINGIMVQSLQGKDISSKRVLNLKQVDGSIVSIEVRDHAPRMTATLFNMDGTSQMMLFDQRIPGTDKDTLIDYTIEVFDLRTGDLLYEVKLVSSVILGFWSHYVIAYDNQAIIFHDLKKNGSQEKHFKHERPRTFSTFEPPALFIRGTTMAIGCRSKVFFYDLNDDSLRTKFNAIKNSGVPSLKFGVMDYAEVNSLAFDDWKLVTVLYVQRSNQILYDTYVSIFDISDLKQIRCLNTIGLRWSLNIRPADILLPPNEKILINSQFSEVTEIDFLHPNLFRNTVKIGHYKEGNILQVETIAPINLTEYAVKTLGLTLKDISHVTYFLREKLDQTEDTISNDNKQDDSVEAASHRVLDLQRLQDKRITFIFPCQDLKYNLPQLKFTAKFEAPWMNTKEFDSHWEVRADCRSSIHLTTTDQLLNETHPHTLGLLVHMTGSEFLLLFEQFDPQTNQWLITDPFIIAGTTFELDALEG